MKTLLLISLLSAAPFSFAVDGDVNAPETIQLPYYDSAEFTPRWLQPDDASLAGFHKIPDFSFSDQDGERVTEKTTEGKIYVANFFFSTCPGICTSIRSKLIKVQEQFIQDDAVLILSHSIRPSNDTVKVLKEYAKKNGVVSHKWHLLTGDKEDIYNLAKNAYFANEDLGNIADLMDFLHSENLLLIDQNRHIRGIYNGLNAASVQNLVTDIEILKESL